jgi:hypothetical protein
MRRFVSKTDHRNLSNSAVRKSAIFPNSKDEKLYYFSLPILILITSSCCIIVKTTSKSLLDYARNRRTLPDLKTPEKYSVIALHPSSCFSFRDFERKTAVSKSQA